VYFAVTCKIASRKILWEDEFFTLYLSSIDVAETWSALLTGADQHPPPFYWLTHLCLSAFGIHHVTVRLPAIAGVWLTCLCVYSFVARRTSPLYGMAAMLVPLVTFASAYAIEARGYGLALGFVAAALLGWQEATSGTRRWLGIAGLALALMGAVSSHYYALLAVVPLVLGEAVRSWKTRRVDLPIWLALASPVLPLVAFLPVVVASKQFSVTFWGRPYWQQAFETYDFLATQAGFSIVLLLAFLAVWIFFRSSHFSSLQDLRLPAHELALVTGILLLPVLTVILALYVTRGFHPRYVLSPVIAIAVMVSWIAFKLCHGRPVAGLCLTLLLLCSFGVNTWRSWLQRRAESWAVAAASRALESSAGGQGPIVVASVTRFYQLSFYSPRRLANRLTYLADPASALRYLGHDTIERGLIDLQPWFPLRVVRYVDFVRTHDSFMAYGDFSVWTWQTWRLLEDGMSMRMVARDNDFVLISVTQTEVAGGARPIDSPTPRVDSLSPDDSLCHRWTGGDRVCQPFTDTTRY
jgi:4-amino-4-deoxy-L-arabinose transferase-like glycosyltransferase